ncbi:MAG: SMC-Scp complex subunit ScpB [Parcubacteria group bacterium]|nr:SMC-Scp complex subunit ScpB [Parcubacteria group bacterium]
MANAQFKKSIEALLFVHGEPLSPHEIAKMVKVKEDDVRVILGELQKEYEEKGIVLVGHGGSFVFSTHPDVAEVLKDIIAKNLEEPLTSSSLETLSIIAYLGPIAKIDIDEMRGVNSYFTLKSLSIRGLVEKKEYEGKSVLYDITFDALRYLGVVDREHLPDFSNFKERLAHIRNTQYGGRRVSS